MDVGHGKKIGRVAVHDHMVFRIDLQACSMAHHVRRKFRGKLPAVRKAPEKLCCFSFLDESNETEIYLRGVLYIFKVFAGACDEKIFPFQIRTGKTGRNFSQDGEIRIFTIGIRIQQKADISAIALVPAMVVHIGGGADHFHHPGLRQNIFHHEFS